MKKNILTVILLLLSVSAMAQNEKCINSAYRMYAQAHINGNFSAGEDLRYKPFKDALNWGADFELGYNFNDYWGLYAEIAWNKNKGATLMRTNQTIYNFTSLEPSLNVTYNLSNGFFGFKPNRRNNLYVHFGPALALRNAIDLTANDVEVASDLEKKTLFGGNLGLNYVYHFNNWIAFTADITGYIYGDKFNGRYDTNVKVDGRINLGAGLRVYLTKSPKPIKEVVTLDREIVKVDTVYNDITEYINDIDLYPVFFDVDKTAIEAVQSPVIKEVADKLIATPSRVVYVIGYADQSSDTKKKVNELAKSRAENITDVLINKYGIDPDRIIQHDMGSRVTPYTNVSNKNRSTICIVTDLKHE